MITRIVIENFKSLRKVDLALGRMNLFIGANSSGKSNFLDALRVLEGIGRGFTINEILNGKPRGATHEVWNGIRGGIAHACFSGADGTDEVAMEVHGTWDSILARTFPKWQYRIVFSPESRGRVTDEYINTMEFVYKHGDFPESFYSEPSQPALGMDEAVNRHRLRRGNLSDVDISYWLVHLTSELNSAQRVDLAPEVLRGYSQYKLAGRMGDHGENFAAVINMICEEDEKSRMPT